MVDEVWVKDFAFRCSRQHTLAPEFFAELEERLEADDAQQRAVNLSQAVGGLATIMSDLVLAHYHKSAVPRPEFFAVDAALVAALPEDPADRDQVPQYAAAQIVTAFCNGDQSIGVQLVMGACFGAGRPPGFGYQVAECIMRELHRVCAHFEPKLGVL